MPAFAETGVLEMDPMIEEAVESHLGKKEDIVFNVEHMSPSLSFKLEELEEKEQMPKLKLPATFRIRFEDGNLSLIREGVEVFREPVSSQYPSIEIRKHTHSKFTLYLNQNEKIQCTAAAASQRDVLTVVFRYHCGKALQDVSCSF